MKLATNTVASSGNINYARKVAMGIDPGASGIILDSLIKIYTNPYTAALREYLSNALDSHREAGQTRPVEVSLPTALSPMLIIEDWGTGMDNETLDQYVQFGWSTKRDSNDDIGGFGLGSKVGLAVTAQYTVQSVKDGKLNTGIIGRDANGNPEMGLLDEQDTDLPNGVKIIIPTAEHRQFFIDRDRFLMGFPAGSVLIDGKPNTVSVYDSNLYTPIEGVGWRSNRDNREELGGVALVHGVVYDLEFSNLSEDFDYRLRRGLFQEVVLDLENGDVDISRSRETLVYSKRTREVLAKKLNGMVEYLSVQYGKDVDTAPTAREALQLRDKSAGIGLDTSEYTWGGEPLTVPARMDYTDIQSSVEFTKVDRQWSGSARSKTRLVRTPVRYGALTQPSAFTDIYSRKHTTLVFSAAPPVHQKNGEILHTVEANALRVYAELQHDDEIGVQYYITSAKLADLPAEFVRGFSTTVSANSMLGAVAVERENRRAAAAAYRKANASPKVRDAELTVRQITLTGYSDNYMESYEEVAVKASELESGTTYVLVQRGIEGVTQAILETISTKLGASNNSLLYKALHKLQRSHNVAFLLLNAGRSTQSYVAQVPNLILASELFNQVVSPIVKAIQASVPDSMRQAKLDDDVAPRWVSSSLGSRLGEVKNVRTREWLKSVILYRSSSATIPVQQGNLNVLAILHRYFNEDAEQFVLSPKTPSTLAEEIMSALPLLRGKDGWDVDLSDIIEYINFKIAE